MTRVAEVEDQFGPTYPDLGSGVAKHRRYAREGLMWRTKAERHAYGEAVEKAIRAKQRSELQRELPSHAPSCASGTAYSDGADIHRAVRAQQRARLLAAPGAERRARSPEKWQEMYDAAMAEKRSRMLEAAE